jgi:long-subunit acyl-CoA synthetase (AMP-forming)
LTPATAPAVAIGADSPALLDAGGGTIGVMTHGQLAASAAASPLRAGDDLMSALAPAYLAERIAVGHWPLGSGATVSFAENRETVGDDLVELRPSVVVGPPRLWKRLRLAIALAAEDATPFQRWMLDRAMGPGAMPLRGWLLSRVRARIGLDRARALINLGDPLGPGLSGWYRTIGRPVVNLASQGTPVEAALRDSLVINDALLVAPGIALVAAEAEPIARFVRRAGVEAVTDQSAFDTPAVHALILDEVRRINAGLPPDRRIGELRLLREGISRDHRLAGPDARLARHQAGQVSVDDAAILRV